MKPSQSLKRSNDQHTAVETDEMTYNLVSFVEMLIEIDQQQMDDLVVSGGVSNRNHSKVTSINKEDNIYFNKEIVK